MLLSRPYCMDNLVTALQGNSERSLRRAQATFDGEKLAGPVFLRRFFRLRSWIVASASAKLGELDPNYRDVHKPSLTDFKVL